MKADPEQEIDRLSEALEYAILVIESYELDIRNSRLGLVEHGFCQGEIYQRAIDDIRRKAGTTKKKSRAQVSLT